MVRRHLAIACSLFLLCVAFLITGCSDVGGPYRIDTGIDPVYQDEEVRFRTTYYLRVFDLCPVEEGLTDDNANSNYEPRLKQVFTARKSGPLQIVKDSLLRFRMTGRASALFSNLHFESGVLREDEIDPFGKVIRYDEPTNTFMNKTTPSNSRDTNTPPVAQTENCQGGKPLDRRVFLLGPEGARELRRDSRLVMAMYTDAKPLINSLKHLAGQQDGEDSKTVFPYERELSRARADEALILFKNQEDETKTALSPATLANRVLAILGREGFSLAPKQNAPADKTSPIKSEQSGIRAEPGDTEKQKEGER